MSFVLRIFFSGLIAFVPSKDGKELTVVLLRAPHAYHLSDGSALAEHKPLLLARAAKCEGNCSKSDPKVARFLFSDKSEEQSLDSLSNALDGGSAWQLAGSDISFTMPAGASEPPLTFSRDDADQSIPRTARERESFRWVTDMSRLDPDGGGFNPKMLSDAPPSLIAARIHLKSGNISTYALIQVDGKVKPVHFKPLGNGGKDLPYTQAVASWVEADIQVPGDSIDVVETNFGGGTKRTMTLSPRNGIVELAVLDLPPFRPPTPGAPRVAARPGKHFELYYELEAMPRPKGQRPVPHVMPSSEKSELEDDWATLHQQEPSDLLERIRLSAGRGPYDLILCPMVRF